MRVPAYEGWETAGFEGLDAAVWLLVGLAAWRVVRREAVVPSADRDEPIWMSGVSAMGLGRVAAGAPRLPATGVRARRVARRQDLRRRRYARQCASRSRRKRPEQAWPAPGRGVDADTAARPPRAVRLASAGRSTIAAGVRNCNPLHAKAVKASNDRRVALSLVPTTDKANPSAPSAVRNAKRRREPNPSRFE